MTFWLATLFMWLSILTSAVLLSDGRWGFAAVSFVATVLWVVVMKRHSDIPNPNSKGLP